MLYQLPLQHGIRRIRWRLQDVRRAVAWLQGVSEAGIHKVLKRLGFSRKQALNFIHSPDPNFRAKWQAVLRAYQEAVEHPDEVVLLFQDELTYYRQPGKAPAYARRGKRQPHAHRQPRPNTRTRLAAVLNALTGQVTYVQRSVIGKLALLAFYAQVRAVYPQPLRLYLVQDNWPTHSLPKVLAAAAHHRLHSLFLPTYASWLNPLEKLWHWLRQQVLHLHPFADDLAHLRQLVCEFLDQFLLGSEVLLRYVGLPV